MAQFWVIYRHVWNAEDDHVLWRGKDLEKAVLKYLNDREKCVRVIGNQAQVRTRYFLNTSPGRHSYTNIMLLYNFSTNSANNCVGVQKQKEVQESYEFMEYLRHVSRITNMRYKREWLNVAINTKNIRVIALDTLVLQQYIDGEIRSLCYMLSRLVLTSSYLLIAEFRDTAWKFSSGHHLKNRWNINIIPNFIMKCGRIIRIFMFIWLFSVHIRVEYSLIICTFIDIFQ
jgi:hypothetical protein